MDEMALLELRFHNSRTMKKRRSERRGRRPKIARNLEILRVRVDQIKENICHVGGTL